MNNIEAAKETIRICREGRYEAGGKSVDISGTDYTDVEVITPQEGEKILSRELTPPEGASMCRITVENSDSFAAARKHDHALVMNFANAHKAGGGFLLGAKAQEEALCRCSTLYSSINSSKASEMYRYNNTHASTVESDYFLISPNVLVIRDEKLDLLPEPFKAAVVTMAAPNKRGAAMFASSSKVRETFERRIRLMLRAAIERDYRTLVLGAWGCGAFGNDPSVVAGYFKAAICDDGLGYFFDEICFAIYGSEDGKNITAFRKVFGEG